jgi:hypothetical protein
MLYYPWQAGDDACGPLGNWGPEHGVDAVTILTLYFLF